MKLINLTQTQYKNYANIHSSMNFGQCVEYTRLKNVQNKDKYFLGLVDNENIIHAAVCIIVTDISSLVKEAIAKDGFLIDYADFELVRTFINELKKYLKKLKVTYLKTDPNFKYKVYNNKNILIENNTSVLDNFIALDFKNNGYNSEFDKFDVIIENYTSVNDIYKNFNRNTKRNITDCLNMGITLHKGKETDMKEFYELVKKKKNNPLSYYQDLLNAFNSKENKMDLFFTKINTEKFLASSKRRYDKEKERNEKIHQTIQRRTGKITDKIYNKKLNSDRTLNKCLENLKMANELRLTGEVEITVGTTAVIKNSREIYFLIDGYSEKYRQIHSSHLLKWAIIQKYYKMGYRKFNLGEIHQHYYGKGTKYYGQYRYKIGFGGNIVEYPPEMFLIINKTTYELSQKINQILKKK